MILKTNDGIVISADAQLASSFTQRTLGLLNHRNSRTLIFNTRFGIHTFFMDKPIDIILLNKSRQIVKIKEGLFPNRFFFYHPRFSYIIEMPFGTIHKFSLAINDKILVE